MEKLEALKNESGQVSEKIQVAISSVGEPEAVRDTKALKVSLPRRSDTKVLLRIIMARMRKSLRPEISQLQFGFVPDKSTRNAIFTLSMLAERCIEMQKDLYLCFIDYSKAFDKVRHEKLFNILEHLDIDGKDLRVIRNLYWDQSAAVRIGGELSEYTLIKRGVRQGCVMSPDLFNIYSEMILRNLENYPGVKINGENINNIRYADDTVLIADSEAFGYNHRKE